MTIRTRIMQLALPYKIGGALVLLAAIVVGARAALFRPVPPAATAPELSHVQLATISSLAASAGPLSVVGTVTSQSQATILAQTSGEIVSLSHALGDRVFAGEIIGQFDNGSEQASLVQAQGAYEAAQAALQQATGATVPNYGITSGQASTAAQNAQTALVAALRSAYGSLDDAVHTRADTLFANPRTASPTLLPFTAPDNQIVVTAQNERIALEAVLANANAAANDSTSTPDQRADALLSDAKTVETFLDNMVSIIDNAVPNTYETAADIAAGQTALSTARTEVAAAVSSVTAAQSAYDTALTTAESAANTAGAGSQSGIAAAQANLKSAQGALDAAQAALEKTIIRSPIAGTIVSLPVTQGDYVSSFAPVATVSNPNALYVDVYVTPDDAKTLAVGGAATIEGSGSGVITFIAPALDPTTGKIEVRVGINGSSGLSAGQVVSLTLARAQAAASAASAASAQLTLPIVAVKMAPQGAEVFTVSASSTLVAHPITLGNIVGDRVDVQGVTPDMQIVTDARGLAAGQQVIVDTSQATSTAL